MTLRSRKKRQWNQIEGRSLFSRVAEQGLLALGRGNGEARCCSGSEKNVLPVFLVGVESRMKRQTNMAGTKLVTTRKRIRMKRQTNMAGTKLVTTRKRMRDVK